jgi:integrase
MRKEGYRESTCYFSVRALKRLDRQVSIFEPEAVKRFLSNASWTEGGKERIAEDIDRFYRYKGIHWERPRYEAVDILPHIPTSTTVQELVSGLSGPVGTFVMLLSETGCRPCEAWLAEWTHVELDRNVIIVHTTIHAAISKVETVSRRRKSLNSIFLVHVQQIRILIETV